MEIWGGNQAVERRFATPGLDLWISSQPYQGDERGGDLYYVSLCGGGVITRLIVADVSGHGAEVAEFSGSLRRLLRRNINRKSQTHLVAALNRQFTKLAQLRRFATAIVVTYLAGQKVLSVSNAGHPRPLWYQAATNQWHLLTPQVVGESEGVAGLALAHRRTSPRSQGVANLPLGFDDSTPYDQFSIGLGPGDLVLFYTDALIEVMDGAGRQLGEAGLLDIVRRLEIDPVTPTAWARLCSQGSRGTARGHRPTMI